MAEGILFGGYLLPEELFIPIFEEWYGQRKVEFKRALQVEIIDVLETMIKTGTRVSKSTGALKSTTIKIKDKYDASVIYNTWERISREYFGNGSVDLIAATKFKGSENYSWTNRIEESQMVNQKGINVRKTELQKLQEEMGDLQTVFAAAELQDLINGHFDNLVKALNTYHLTHDDAVAMHELLGYRKSKLNRPGFTNSTYNKIIYGGQSNAAGKQLDAYMNHMGNYHQELFALMSGQLADANSLANAASTFHDDFSDMFANKRDEVQVWLLDSLNSASWLTGGDIIVVGKSGAVIYNIQLKTTGRGKTFEVASSALLSFAKEMVRLIDSQEATPKELAEYMFKTLKTSSANDINITEDFIESQSYRMVEENLKLNKGSLNISLS